MFTWFWCTVGGIAGLNAGIIEDSINMSDVIYFYCFDENRSVGGIVGINTGNIKRCTNDRSVLSFLRTNDKSAGVNHSVNNHRVWQKEESPGELRKSLCSKELRSLQD
jgi:hypothetical protein